MYKHRFNKLTKDVCWNLAKSCSTCTEFWTKYKTAAGKASQEGWITDYTWLSLQHERRLTRERCFELAQDCSTKKELKKKHPGVLARAKREGWIEDYTWLVSGRIKRTYSVCENEAKKYRTVADFRKYSPNLHDAAYKNGWLSNFTWLQRSELIENRCNDNVYAYEFTSMKAVYIGRTVNLKERNQAHHHEHSTVCKFATHNAVEIPTMKVLEHGITLKAGLIKEDYWVQQYKKAGWTILNICKTGLTSGSLGALGTIRISKQMVDNAAHRYRTLNEFRKLSPHEYDKASKKGWLSSYTWLSRDRKPRNTWTEEQCFTEAKKYKTVADFKNNSPVAYTIACSHKWLGNYSWLKYKKVVLHTFEECEMAAQKYTTIHDFRNGDRLLYRAARKRNWILQFTWLSTI